MSHGMPFRCLQAFCITIILLISARGQEKSVVKSKDPLRELLVSKGYTPITLVQNDDDSRFLIECRIGKEKFYMLLDTGAASSSIDIELAKKLGLKSHGDLKAGGIGGSLNGIKVSIRDLMIGDFDTREMIRELNVAAFNYTTVRATASEHNSRKIDGLLGDSALEFNSAIIDYPKRTLYLRTPLRALWPEIEGRWVATNVKENEEEKPFDAKMPPRLTFKDRQIIISNGFEENALGIHVVPDKGRYTLALFPPEKEKDETLKYTGAALLKVSNDKMTVCLSLDASKSAPIDFKSPADSGYILLELRREK
jgi:hypothetical protein